MRTITRTFLAALAVSLFAPAIAPAPARADDATVKVYKSPTCGCCSKWISHLEANGFTVEATDVRDVTPIKQRWGVPVRLSSCHTAKVEGYVIEGHVPAEDVQRLLRERPEVTGLAVPRMPIGSPGMEGPNPEPYDVIAFDAKGTSEVFSSHAP